MNQIIKQNLREELVRVINSFNPEYVDMSSECDTYISGLLDSIERFGDECASYTQDQLEKQQGLVDQNKN